MFTASRTAFPACIPSGVTRCGRFASYAVSTQEAYVFVSERGGPISPIGFHRLIQRVGEAAKMPFPIHPHMLRHACGFKLANDGHDTRALQHYLGHKNIHPRGSYAPSRERARFSSEFISALLRDFRQGGPAAIAKVRKYQPAAYLKICALLVPKEMKLEGSADAIKAMTTEQIECG